MTPATTLAGMAEEALADASHWPTNWVEQFEDADPDCCVPERFRCWIADGKDDHVNVYLDSGEDYEPKLAKYIATMNTREPLLAAGYLDLTRQLAEARAALSGLEAAAHRSRCDLMDCEQQLAARTAEIEALRVARDAACDLAEQVYDGGSRYGFKENQELRAERNRMWPVWKLRYVLRHKLGMLLRDYPDDKETASIIAELEGAIRMEEHDGLR